MTTGIWLKRKIRALPLWLGVVLCCLAPALAGASHWTTPTTVDNTATDTGKFASLALDSNNKLHISYFDTAANLMYATNKNGSWDTLAVITGNVGTAGTSITVDDLNNPQINYYYNFNGGGSNKDQGARNIAFNGSSWGSATNIQGTNNAPAENSTVSVVNKNGISQAVYFRGNALWYNVNVSAHDYRTWNTAARLDPAFNIGLYNAIAVDSNGRGHVVAYDSTNGNLKYYTNITGTWTIAPLDSSTNDVGAYCSIQVGGTGASETLHVAYLDKSTNLIKYATKPVSGGSWTIFVDPQNILSAGTDTISYLGGHTSIAVDSAGAAHISFDYNNAGTANLRYATNAGGAWHVEDVDKANAGTYTSIAVGSDQTVYIAYYDVANTALKVATKKAFYVNPDPADFDTVDRGFQSTAQAISITNNLQVNQTIGTVGIGGANPGDFAFDGDSCSGGQFPPDASCTVQLHFAPPASAPRSSARGAALDIHATTPFVLANSATLSGSTSDKFLLTASAGSGGSIDPLKIAMAPGSSQTFTVTPIYGYGIGTVTDNGNPMSGPGYTLSGIADDHTLVASFVNIAPFRILQTLAPYLTLQAAYDAATPTEYLIEGKAGAYATENLTVFRNITTILKGGYDSVFASQTGSTTMHRILVSVPNNNPGKLIVEKVVLK